MKLALPTYAITALLILISGITEGCQESTPDPTDTITITEDDPRWDCRTMGNRICGPNR